MITYLFTIYVTDALGTESCGNRTVVIEDTELNGAFKELIDRCYNAGVRNWFVVYVFSESNTPLKVNAACSNVNEI